MTQGDFGGTYSPVPGGAAGPPPIEPMPWASPGPVFRTSGPPAPAPRYPPPVALPQHSPPARKRRRGVLALVIALSLVLILATVAGVVALTPGSQQVSDPTHRITMTVPRMWSDDTSPDAGQRVQQGKDSYLVPNLEVRGSIGVISGVIIDRADASLTEVHGAEVKRACDALGCLSHGQRVKVELNGRRGLEQVLRHRDDQVTIMLTLESPTLVVNLAGETQAPPGDPVVDQLTEVMYTLTVHR